MLKAVLVSPLFDLKGFFFFRRRFGEGLFLRFARRNRRDWFDGISFFKNRDVNLELRVDVKLLVMFSGEGKMLILGYRDVTDYEKF